MQQQTAPVMLDNRATKNFISLIKVKQKQLKGGTLQMLRQPDKHDESGYTYQHWGLRLVNDGETRPDTEIWLLHNPKMDITLPVTLKIPGSVFVDAYVQRPTGFGIDAKAAETITPLVSAWINYQHTQPLRWQHIEKKYDTKVLKQNREMS